MNDFYCDEVISGKTQVKNVFETTNVLAFHHTKPHWSVHIVVFPKQHIASLLNLKPEHNNLLLELFVVIKQVTAKVTQQTGSCRVLTNLGSYQDSKHLHWHIVSGEPIV